MNDTDALEQACEYIAKRDTCPYGKFVNDCGYTEEECENREPYLCWMQYFRGEME